MTEYVNAAVYLVCVKESCQLVRSVQGARLVPLDSRTQRVPLVELQMILNLRTFKQQEEMMVVG